MYKKIDQNDIDFLLEIFNIRDMYLNLKDYLPILSNYRNLCAHEEIMFEHKTQKQIRNNFYHKWLCGKGNTRLSNKCFFDGNLF